jgi:ParB family transcriptional regulator, chromosome partitioning protein
MTIATADPKRRALGKGLDSLLPRVPAKAVEQAATEAETGRPREISVETIDRNPYQTRTSIDDAQLAELAASITANGVVQPILVRPQANGRFQLIAGERRWRASMLAGKKTIPAILRQVSDEQALEITIVENLQREDLNPLEEAAGYERLIAEFGYTQESLAERVGKERSTVANALRLLRLPESIKQAIVDGQLSMGHARALLAVSDEGDLKKAAERVIAENLSVRAVEALVQRLKSRRRPKQKRDGHAGVHVRHLVEKLQRKLGTKVELKDRGGSGTLEIRYGSLQELDRVLAAILGG